MTADAAPAAAAAAPAHELPAPDARSSRGATTCAPCGAAASSSGRCCCPSASRPSFAHLGASLARRPAGDRRRSTSDRRRERVRRAARARSPAAPGRDLVATRAEAERALADGVDRRATTSCPPTGPAQPDGPARRGRAAGGLRASTARRDDAGRGARGDAPRGAARAGRASARTIAAASVAPISVRRRRRSTASPSRTPPWPPRSWCRSASRCCS